MNSAWQFAEKRREKLVRFLMSHRATHEEALDIVSAVTVKFSAKAHGIAPKAWETYLHRACMNTWRDTLRRCEHSNFRLAFCDGATQPPDTSCELREAIRTHTSELDYRIIDLRAEGLMFSEIGEMIGMKGNRAKNRFLRARKRLQRHLSGVYG